MGLITRQKSLRCLVSSHRFLQVFKTSTANWRGFRTVVKEEEFNEYLIKKEFCIVKAFFKFIFQFTEEVIAAFSSCY